MSAVNLTTGNTTAVALRDAPLAVVFPPDSAHAYVRNVPTLAVIDTTTNDAVDIAIGDLPMGLQLSPDGKRAYITNFGDSTLSVVDTITNSVAMTVDVPGYSEAVGERVYVGDYWSGPVAVILVPTVRDLHTDAANTLTAHHGLRVEGGEGSLRGGQVDATIPSWVTAMRPKLWSWSAR